MRHPPSHPRARADDNPTSGHPRQRLSASLTRHACRGLTAVCSAAWLLHGAPAQAQTPANADAALERSQKQSDNVYRWIKLHAEPPRKPEPGAKPRPRADATAQVPRRSDARMGQPEAATATEAAATEGLTVQDTAQELAASAAPVAAASAAAPATPPAAAAVAAEVEKELRPLSQPQPEIPRELRNAIANGRVLLSFTVQPDGSVAQASVLNSTNRRLAKPALDAVSQWRFEPIRTARAVQVEIEFNLQ